LIQWLSGLFGADLIILETFGSDTDPPNLVSVDRVRECNFFVGIYAHRYGTIDKQTGKSITELELEEAERSLSAGLIEEILLYTSDPAAPWPEEYREVGEVAESGLSRLKEKVARHTYTVFKDEKDLLIHVVRDLHKRLYDHSGFRHPVLRTTAVPGPSILSRPVGMEFLTSRDRDYLLARGEKLDELLGVLDSNSVVLLLGNSGVGKTSLIHAGLLPKAEQRGWFSIYTRPMGSLPADIVKQVQSAVFEGHSTYRGPLVPLLAEITAALPSKRILLVIDQFEDILNVQDERQRTESVTDIAALRNTTMLALSVLISYRADLEGRLGQYWQIISGSPAGLPRVYLGGMDPYEAWRGTQKTIQDLSLKVGLDPEDEDRIREDLLVSSRTIGYEGIYPPYVQMLIDHVWSMKDETDGYGMKDYRRSGSISGIIGSYLQRRLKYAQDQEGHIRTVLVSLVRSYGAKAQKSIDEIAAETGLSKSECERCLEILIDLRLVRPIDDFYEVSHDFIAQKIMTELVDQGEREFKRYRELLAANSATYESTHAAGLRTGEMLMLYKHRRRLLPNDVELRLLLESWIEGNGPALYWLMKAAPAKIREWLTTVESRGGLHSDGKISVALLRSKLGEGLILDKESITFHDYQMGTEIASLIQKDPLSLAEDLLTDGLRHRREEVRDASKVSFFERLKNGQWDLLSRVRNSSSKSCREAYMAAVVDRGVPVPSRKMQTAKVLREFVILKSMTSLNNPSKIDPLLGTLRQSRPPRWVMLFGEAIRYVRTKRLDFLLRRAMRSSGQEAQILLASVAHSTDPEEFDALASAYELCNSREKDRFETVAIYAKAEALANAIRRVANRGHMPRLRSTLEKMSIKQSSRSVILAALENGIMDDFRLVLDKVAGTEEKIYIWSHTQIGHAAARRLLTTCSGIPNFLLDIARTQEFWGGYIHSSERKDMPKEKLLPLNNFENRTFFIRLAAYAMIGAATEKDEELLAKLASHKYGLVAQFAAARLVRLTGERGLDRLSSRIDENLKEDEAQDLAGALRAGEMDFYGLIRVF
jgi:hypothetical protein